MASGFNFNDRLLGMVCPGCQAAYACGSVAPQPVAELEPHLETVHGWTREEVQEWLDTGRQPRRSHRGAGWGSLNGGNVPCSTCTAWTADGICRRCTASARLTPEEDARIADWMGRLANPAKKKFATAYVAAYRARIPLPAGEKFGLPEVVIRSTVTALLRLGMSA